MAIFKAIASAALLVASAGWSDAFAPVSRFPASNSNSLQPQTLSSGALCMADGDSEPTPCEAPSDVEAAFLDDASSLKNALVTNIKGEVVALGDAMASKTVSTKTFDTSVLVFLRHLG